MNRIGKVFPLVRNGRSKGILLTLIKCGDLPALRHLVRIVSGDVSDVFPVGVVWRSVHPERLRRGGAIGIAAGSRHWRRLLVSQPACRRGAGGRVGSGDGVGA
jgi:hypothetical protein